MKSQFFSFAGFFCIVFLMLANPPSSPALNADTAGALNERVELDNPISVEYLENNLQKETPRLVLTPAIKENLQKKLESDPVVRNLYRAIRLNAERIQDEPLLEREVVGRRLLSTSREMLYRINMLGIVYLMEKDPDVLRRIDEEVLAVIDFEDWNPSHFLDVAEMALAVALAIDWAGSDLPESTVERAKAALREKALIPSFDESGSTWWVNTANNWNQVCHGGMIAAAVVVAEEDPELASRTISRALENIPHALEEYGPDGVYPEGPTYWSYGTSFSVLTSSMLESAFGTDFGLAEYPAFMESADFRVLSVAPSGWYYNFADSGDKRSENGDVTLAWFAARTGNSLYFEKERFLRAPEEMGKLTRHAGAGFVWVSQFEEKDRTSLPLAWKGEGANPVFFFRGGEDDPRQYYFGGKGGRGTVNHGNLDAGSFVFELNGVRWVIDPGIQSYHPLEAAGFNLWGSCQECERWTLLTKNNFGHSTLTVNDELHVVDGFASISDFSSGENPEATVDMSAVFEGQLQSAQRRFKKDGPASLLLEDELEVAPSTESITWQLMTTADVIPTANGARLEQDGEQLNLTILSPSDVSVSVVSLDPPPLELDKRIEGLKRVEIRIPAEQFPGERVSIQVRLSSED
ncbi:MAG: heparinase II/III family protein [Opitutales bacterium]